ncbi:histone-lysine N-methyltransferase SUVR4 isoform X1 [Ricinus communis]|uniref:histone-lysine N-methyltransferase SUVR4 isoform X1 n=1 Tax=Ricinus communis TaxID=3988 RepID=UPI00201A3DE9|nr:histone-lysine N-methyltransferase SUVR4 isoform X1 [Ricinus communis]
MVNERALNAFKATRALGIPDKEVKPVLKNLWKVFDKNWEPIEAEDYRALIDAYFDSKENKKPSISKVSHADPRDDRISISRRTSVSPGNSKRPTVECGSSDYSRDHTNPIAKKNRIESTDFADSIAVVHPGSGSNGSKHSGSNFSVAVSSLEKVKILLNFDYAIGQPSFQIPDFTAVLKFLEDKYLGDKFVSSQFSVTTLLKDLCESYLELGTVSSNSSVADSTPTAGKINNSLHRIGSNESSRRIGNSDTILKEKASKCSRLSYSHNLENMQQGTTTYNQKRFFPKISDISKGAENVPISLVNEIGDEELPKFMYMPQSIIYQNAYLQISLARISDDDCCSSCLGDCLSSPIPCACARETGGEFAYTQQGLLKQEFLRACESMKQDPQKDYLVFCKDCPLVRSKNEYMPEKCKGHLVRKFIKECWRKCGCDMNCGNRVIQRGITCNLQVFMTGEGKGWGLRTLEDLPKGTFVCEYVGEILTNMELYDRNLLSSGSDRHTYPVTLDADWGSEKFLRDEEALCLDATFTGNVARFINHRCNDANLIDIPVEVETPDRHYYHLAFFTSRKVNALEELTWDYGIDFDDHDHPIEAFRCCCGSDSCRDVKGKRRRNSTSCK